MPVTFSGAVLRGTTTISPPPAFDPIQLFGANVQGVWVATDSTPGDAATVYAYASQAGI